MGDSSWGSKMSTFGKCFVISRDFLVNYYFFQTLSGPKYGKKELM